MRLNNPETYEELRSLAKHFMSGERKDHTFSGTDLFHEAYSRLSPMLKVSESEVDSLRALFAVTMRRILIEHARKRSRRVRKLTNLAVPTQNLSTLGCATTEEDRADHTLTLDAALQRLAVDYPLHAKIVEYKFFGGMTFLQCSMHLEIGEATVHRYWNFARAWISREMHRIETGLARGIDRSAEQSDSGDA